MIGTCQAAPRIIAGMARRAEAAGPFLVRGLDGVGGGGWGEERKVVCVREVPARSRRRSEGSGAAVRQRLAPRPLPLLDVSVLSLRVIAVQ